MNIIINLSNIMYNDSNQPLHSNPKKGNKMKFK
jgi:hypothetical protein